MTLNLHKKTKKAFSQEAHLTNVSVSTTEEIHKKYIKEFLRTNIQNSNLQITSNSRLFYSFFYESKIYEIYFIKDYTKKSIIPASVFYEIHDEKYIELFVTERYFVVFKHGELALFKDINDVTSNNEILNFIKQRYQIDIHKIHTIDSAKLKDIQQKYILNKDKKEPQLLSLKKDKSITYLFSFIIFVLLIPIIHFNFFYDENKNSKNLQKKISILEKKYSNMINNKNSKKTNQIITTLSNIKSFNGLILKTFILNKNKLHIFLESTKRINLINFTEQYNTSIKIDKINFNPHDKKYILEAEIVL